MENLDHDFQRLFHIVKYCEKLRAVKRDVKSDYSVFISKENYQKVDVCAFYIGQIGELINGLSGEFKARHPEIPFRAIVKMRNLLVHHYGTRDVNILWDVLETDAPQLNKICRGILSEKSETVDDAIKKELKNETDIF